MQYANVRGAIALEQIRAIVVAKLVHLDDALIVQLDVQIILEYIDLLWLLPCAESSHHIAIFAIQATRLNGALAIIGPIQTTCGIINRETDWPANITFHQTLLVAAIQGGNQYAILQR